MSLVAKSSVSKWGPKTLWEEPPEGRAVQAVPVHCHSEKITQGRRQIFVPVALSGFKKEVVLTYPGGEL